jgi:hypothetical protein
MDEKQVTLEAWKQAVAVQMHFNEMAMKLRAFALTLVAALVTAESLSTHAGVATGAALVVWLAFYLMDRFWYHCLLIGSVLYGRALEDYADKKLEMRFPPAPKNNPPKIYSSSQLGIADYIGQTNQEHWKWRANRKIDTYYGLIALALFIILLARLQQ